MTHHLSASIKINRNKCFPRSDKLGKIYSDKLLNPGSDFWRKMCPGEKEFKYSQYQKDKDIWNTKILGLIEHFDNDYQMLNSNAVPPSIQHKYYELTLAWNDYIIGTFYNVLKSCTSDSIKKCEDKLLEFYTKIGKFNEQVAEEIIESVILKDYSIETSCVRNNANRSSWDITLRNNHCIISDDNNIFGNSLTRDDMRWYLRKSDTLHIPSCKDLYRKRINRDSYVKDMVIHSLLRQGFRFASIKNALCYFASLVNDLYNCDDKNDFRHIDGKRLTKNQQRCIKNWFLDIDTNPTEFVKLVKGIAEKAKRDYGTWLQDIKYELFEIQCTCPFVLTDANLILTFDEETESSKAGFHISLLSK